MCGIVALFSAMGEIDEFSLSKAIASLHHRGPDGQRSWIAPHRRVGLGHARLSIIDLQTGEQPIANGDGSLQMATEAYKS
jgi:asparagine synthase (glutamine-hydrolysing)